MDGVSDHDDHEHDHHAIGIPLPPGMIRAMMAGHDNAHARAEERHNASMRWLDGLDVEGLLCLRWVLQTNDPDEAYGNNRYYDGMAVQLLRAKGVDPRTGLDPAAALLENAPAAAG